MQVHLLLTEIQNQGLNIQAIEGNLDLSPSGRITDAMRQTIRQYKADLVAFLENYEERAAIMEFDGGMTRQEAETAAWEDLSKRE